MSCFILLSLVGALQASDIAVSASVAPDSITLGDRVVLTITVEHATNDSFEWPKEPERLGSFEVMSFRALEPVVVEGRARSQAQYELTVFELGELEIPAMGLEITLSDSAETRTFETEPVKVIVYSVGVADSADIKDIKPPLGIARNWWLLLPWILAALALAAALFWLVRRMRRGDSATSVTPQRLPHEIAYAALDALESSQLLERGDIKRYFTEASEIVRVYLEGRFGIVAMEMTSRDISRELESRQLRRRELQSLEDFIRRSDLVKFAKHRPGVDSCKALVPAGRTFVDETMEVDEVESELVGAGGRV